MLGTYERNMNRFRFVDCQVALEITHTIFIIQYPSLATLYHFHSMRNVHLAKQSRRNATNKRSKTYDESGLVHTHTYTHDAACRLQ